jgi:hypothetical protein
MYLIVRPPESCGCHCEYISRLWAPVALSKHIPLFSASRLPFENRTHAVFYIALYGPIY